MRFFYKHDFPGYRQVGIGRLHFAAGVKTSWPAGVRRIARNVLQIVAPFSGGAFLCIGWTMRRKSAA